MEMNMRVQAVAHEERSPTAGWTSRKSQRALMLVGALLILSIAVNAMIVLLAGGRF